MKRSIPFIIAIMILITGCNSNSPSAPPADTTAHQNEALENDESIVYHYEGTDGVWTAEFQAELFMDPLQQVDENSSKKYGHNYELKITYDGELEKLSSYRTIGIYCDTGLEKFGQSFTYTDHIEEKSFTLKSNQPGGAAIHDKSEISVEVILDGMDKSTIELVNTDELLDPTDVFQTNLDKSALENGSANNMIVTIDSALEDWEFYAWAEKGVIYNVTDRSFEYIRPGEGEAGDTITITFSDHVNQRIYRSIYPIHFTANNRHGETRPAETQESIAENVLTNLLSTPNEELKTAYDNMFLSAETSEDGTDSDKAASSSLVVLDSKEVRDVVAKLLDNRATDLFLESCLRINEVMSLHHYAVQYGFQTEVQELSVRKSAQNDTLEYDAALQIVVDEGEEQVIHGSGLVQFDSENKISAITFRSMELSSFLEMIRRRLILCKLP